MSGNYTTAVGVAAAGFLLGKFLFGTTTYDMLAIDCEMVGGYYGSSILARVSVVDEKLKCVYDTFVKPTEEVWDYRTPYSGITPEMLQKGRPFREVQEKIQNLMEGILWIGHSVEFDMAALQLIHPRELTKDVALYPPFKRNGQKRSLKALAKEYLGLDIQVDTHDSMEDARATMMLYNKIKRDF